MNAKEIQAKVCELLNKWDQGYETRLLEEFSKWLEKANADLLDTEIIYDGRNYGKSNLFIVKPKKKAP